MGGHTSRNYKGALLKRGLERSELINRLTIPARIHPWLVSETFTLAFVGPDLFAAPVLPHSPPELDVLSTVELAALLEQPMIADENSMGVGKPPNLNYVPPAIVVWGRARYLKQCLAKTDSLSIWVGDRVFEVMEVL